MHKLVSIPLLVLLVGCVSAEKRFEQAQQAEAEGRWAQAADLYIDALRKDAELPGARERLSTVGARALADKLELAERLERNRQYAQAVNEYGGAANLVDRAAAVRVALELPADFVARKEAAIARATDQALENADALLADRRYEQAIARYRDAKNRYVLDDAQTARWNEGLLKALLGSADQLRLQGQYRPAYDRVLEALAFRDTEEARRLRDTIVEEGTVTVAVLPVWRADDTAATLPPGLLAETNDHLEEGLTAETPLFLRVVDAVDTRKKVRALGFDRMAIRDRQAAVVGEQLGAQYVVVPWIARASIGVGKEGTKVAVPTTDGGTAEIETFQRRDLVAFYRFRVVRVLDGQTAVTQDDVRIKAGTKVKSAIYGGDMTKLLLTQEQHRWFDGKRLAELDRKMTREVAHALAESLAASIRELDLAP
ncbi:MAG: hypothetical protein AAGD14_03040 [Planctomycetota bacterium]